MEFTFSMGEWLSLRGNHRTSQRSDDISEGGVVKVDVEVLRKEYRNMQSNHNVCAHETDLASNVKLILCLH